MTRRSHPAHRFLTLAGFTLRETLRQPVYLLVTLTFLFVSASTSMLVSHQFGEPGKLARDGALAFHLVFGMVLSGYAACSSLGTDLRTGAAALILSRPLSRETYLLAKFAGIAVALLLFSTIAGMATLLCERIAPRNFEIDWRAAVLFLGAIPAALAAAAAWNFGTRKPFASAAVLALTVCLFLALTAAAALDPDGHRAAFGSRIDWRLVPASLQLALAVVVFAALSLSLATRFRLAPVIALLILLVAGGLLVDYLAALSPFGAIQALRCLLPDWQSFWSADALRHHGSLSWAAVATSAAYAAAYSAGVLGLGMLSFRMREV